jgi:hypothetical protein
MHPLSGASLKDTLPSYLGFSCFDKSAKDLEKDK